MKIFLRMTYLHKMHKRKTVSDNFILVIFPCQDFMHILMQYVYVVYTCIKTTKWFPGSNSFILVFWDFYVDCLNILTWICLSTFFTLYVVFFKPTVTRLVLYFDNETFFLLIITLMFNIFNLHLPKLALELIILQL